MTLKMYDIEMDYGFAGEHESEITGVYLAMMMTAQAELALAKIKFEFLREEYYKLRKEELKKMPYKDYLKSCEWQSKRKTALKDADYKCQLCGVADTEMHVHHKNYDRRGEELPEDLIVLCKNCHAKHHDKEPQ